MLDVLMTEQLWTVILISLTFSIFLMALVQKIKTLNIIKQKWHIWLVNFTCAFLMGIPFGMHFYELPIEEAIWMSLFGFIGAPSIYEALKNQNIINYKPKSSSEIKNNTNTTCISRDNEIKRSDL